MAEYTSECTPGPTTIQEKKTLFKHPPAESLPHSRGSGRALSGAEQARLFFAAGGSVCDRRIAHADILGPFNYAQEIPRPQSKILTLQSLLWSEFSCSNALSRRIRTCPETLIMSNSRRQTQNFSDYRRSGNSPWPRIKTC